MTKNQIRKQYLKPKDKRRSRNLYLQFKLNKCKLKKHNEWGMGGITSEKLSISYND